MTHYNMCQIVLLPSGHVALLIINDLFSLVTYRGTIVL